jgi:hypothetical protein
MSERIYLTKKDKIEVNENNLVNLTLQDGRVFEKLEPRRLFPVSRIDEYITLLDSDGIEIAVIRKLTDIDDKSREIIGYSLDDYYLVPHITKIISISEKNGKVHWIVETDRGYKEFDIRNRNHDVRVYSDGRVRVRDSDDNRYIISDYRKLDSHSRRQAVADL